VSDVLIPDAAILAGRSHWRYRGQQRPEFAEPTQPGEESVWDFPRPPRQESVESLVEVRNGGSLIAQSGRTVRVLETAGAPTYYLPPEDVQLERLHREGEASVCEWKGIATTFRVDDLPGAAWCYERTFAEFSGIRGWLAFYPTLLECFVAGERVRPQPGGYYGGWVLANLRGPVKGEPGSSSW
jgi:uncharacterized protein (DUF427 family)